MKEPVCEQLTFFPVDFLASHSPLPGSEEARRTTVISGLKCSESYGNSGPLGSLVRTCLESSIWHSTRCFLTWKKTDTPHKRLLFRLAVSMPRTNEKGSAFWPTPVHKGGMCGGTGAINTLKAMEKAGQITHEERMNFQQGSGGKINPGLLEWLMGYEQAFTKLIPTPTATDYKGGCRTRYFNGGVGVRRTAEKLSGTHSAWENWPDEPGILRVADGIPHRMDRIKCLGNAVVPQQFYPFFMAIAKEMEKDDQTEL